jgi:hypothetical protein
MRIDWDFILISALFLAALASTVIAAARLFGLAP